jgi:hypothetical protein
LIAYGDFSAAVRQAAFLIAATAFLFKLISELQFSGTVPMVGVQAYAQWLSKGFLIDVKNRGSGRRTIFRLDSPFCEITGAKRYVSRISIWLKLPRQRD